MMAETIVDFVGIVVTMVSTIVTGISIAQSAKANTKHQKSNRSDQS